MLATIVFSVVLAVLWIGAIAFFARLDVRWRRLVRRLGRRLSSPAEAPRRRPYDYAADQEAEFDACAALEERLRGVVR